jgi:energy-converting hydrogenase B subunit D
VIVLQAVVMGLVAFLGLAVVRTHDPLRQVVVLCLFGIGLAALFLFLQAPDVALSEVTVGMAYPVLVLLTLVKIRERER